MVEFCFPKSSPIYYPTWSSQHPLELANSLFPPAFCGWRKEGSAELSRFTKATRIVVASLELQSWALTCRSVMSTYVWESGAAWNDEK